MRNFQQGSTTDPKSAKKFYFFDTTLTSVASCSSPYCSYSLFIFHVELGGGGYTNFSSSCLLLAMAFKLFMFITSALPSVFTLPSYMYTPTFFMFLLFYKPDTIPVGSIYTDLLLYTFSCTRNSPHDHLTKCRSYQLENL